MSHGPVSLDTARRALAHIPAHDRDLWVRMSFALKSEHGEDAKQIFLDWSATAENFQAKAAEATWKSAKAGQVGIGTLLYEAKQRGFALNGEGSRIDPAEIERHRRDRAEAARKDAERDFQERAKAAKLAEEIYGAAEAASPNHPYLTRKAISVPHGVRVGHWYQIGPDGERYREKENCLLVPMRDAEGKLWNLQAIFPEADAELERDKDYLSGGRKQGCYFSIGKPEGAVAIGEGFATMQSIRAATGIAVCVAFDRGNLPVVAKALREKLGAVRLILAADNDIQEGKPNYGVLKATEAAQAVNGLLAIPELDGEKADFNDLAQARGDDAVKAQIEAARSLEVQAPVEIVQGWPAPEKLPELPEVPAFNFDVLPGPLRDFVHDIAERMQCPPEFAAVGVVVAAGSAIGRKLGIRPMQFDDWTVIPNVWGAIVGLPGLKKSPALAEAIAPLKRMQAKAFEEYEAALAEFEIQERAAKIRSTTAEQSARKAYEKDKSVNLGAMLRPDAELVEPKRTRYVVNDSSPEALCETLKDNPNGVLVERDELIGLLRSMDKEGSQEARALYLTAADGNKSHTVDRIGRGSGRHIPALCVSMLGGIQPGVLASYVRETQRGGVGDDGLLQRFGMLVYPDLGGWKLVDRKPDVEAKHAAYALVERLCNLTAAEVGAELDTYSEVPFLHFEENAQALFNEWLADIEGRIRSGEDHPAITSHLAKYRKTAPALALINHLCDGGTGPVSEAATGRALLFIELLEAHARRVYSYAARPDLDAAKTILAKLRTGKLPIEFNARHVYRAGWSGLSSPDEAYPALRALVDFGYLREHTNTETGGKHSTIYRAHPSTKAAA